MQGPRGVVVVGPHMSNFDLAGQWFAAQGLDIQVLSLAEPDAGTRMINRLRRKLGMQVTPIDLDTLRESLQRLRGGGIVMTGVDRPVSLDDEPIPFLGAPARLPTGHVRLALQADARVVVACCREAEDGVYEIEIAPPLEMEHVGRRADDVRHNTRRILAIIEDLILRAPEQWLMLVPVWRPEDEAAAD
jgi:KDO2-lipid IV(A) lauroyltransferase